MTRSIIAFLFLCILSCTNAQTSIGFEFQAYPTGLIPGLRIDRNLNEFSKVHLRLGYNWIRHGDLGVHLDERGDGFGFSLGYSKTIPKVSNKLSLGIWNDVWWNSIDWEDNIPKIRGTSNITVLQPTIKAEYTLIDKGISISPSLAFGYEWNVITDGAPTGQGAILLIGVLVSL